MWFIEKFQWNIIDRSFVDRYERIGGWFTTCFLGHFAGWLMRPLFHNIPTQLSHANEQIWLIRIHQCGTINFARDRNVPVCLHKIFTASDFDYRLNRNHCTASVCFTSNLSLVQHTSNLHVHSNEIKSVCYFCVFHSWHRILVYARYRAPYRKTHTHQHRLNISAVYIYVWSALFVVSSFCAKGSKYCLLPSSMWRAKIQKSMPEIRLMFGHTPLQLI